MDEEESYFDCDDGEDEVMEAASNANSTNNSDSDLHRTQRMFSLSDQATSLDSLVPGGDEQKSNEGSADNGDAASGETETAKITNMETY